VRFLPLHPLEPVVAERLTGQCFERRRDQVLLVIDEADRVDQRRDYVGLAAFLQHVEDAAPTFDVVGIKRDADKLLDHFVFGQRGLRAREQNGTDANDEHHREQTEQAHG